jgi:hypothetical protein
MTGFIIDLKLWAVAATGLSKDALHVHLSLIILLATAVWTKRPLSSPVPWLVVLAAALVGESFDYLAEPRPAVWRDRAIHDLVNTMFWPTALLLLGRMRRLKLR